MYAEVGWIAKAQIVFDTVVIRDVVIWNALIGGYVKQGFGKAAFEQFEMMQQNGISPSAVTYVCILKACASMNDIEKGNEIHSEILRNGLLEKDLILGNTLIDMYVKSGLFLEAEELFEMLPVRSVVTWTALLAGHVKVGNVKKALHFFKKMRHSGCLPNAVTYASVLRACANLEDREEGQRLHAEVVSIGLETDLAVGSALVNMYASCGSLGKAQDVFNKLCHRSVALWTVLINGYVNHEKNDAALVCWDLMQCDGIVPNAITFVCSLKACSNNCAIEKGQEIHTELARFGHLENEMSVSNALIDMYLKCGLVAKAGEVFDRLTKRDTITWTSLISGYVQHEYNEQALECYKKMRQSGCSPSAATFVCILQACGKVGATAMGEHLHIEASQKGFDTNVFVASTLMHMYARSGSLSKAQQVFKMIPVQDEALWHVLIAGYVQLGDIEGVFSMLEKMLQEGKRPDPITFIIVLNVCSRAGLVSNGWTFFESMSKEHGIVPKYEHLSCMVDLHARAGELSEAVAKVKKFSNRANVAIWRTILSACHKLGNVNLGKYIFEATSESNWEVSDLKAYLIASCKNHVNMLCL